MLMKQEKTVWTGLPAEMWDWSASWQISMWWSKWTSLPVFWMGTQVHRSVKGWHTCIYSILIRALHLISAYLGCIIYFCYLQRMSTWDAKLADRLSRESTTSTEDKKLLNSFPPIQNVELLWKMAAESRRGFLFGWVSAGRDWECDEAECIEVGVWNFCSDVLGSKRFKFVFV